MSDPPTYDQDLLSRLNALKKSSITLDASKSKPVSQPSQQTNLESHLSTRLRNLRNASSSTSPAGISPPLKDITALPSVPATLAEDPDPLRNPIDIDDKTLDELLADLGPEDQWTLNPDDPKDIQKLLDEAKSALPSNEAKPDPNDEEAKERSQTAGPSKLDKKYITRDIDMSVFSLDDGQDSKDKARHSRLEYESREAEDIVAQLLDEVNFERANEPQEPEEVEEDSSATQKEVNEDDGLSLPSAPSSLPWPPRAEAEPSKKSFDFESDIAARMAALKGLGSTNELGLPSAPSFKPADKPMKGVMKKFTDEEVDSWCIICQDDATVKCFGCDGDLYCATCWKEGHMGPDVGWEEKRHKWTKYRKPN